MKDSVRLVISGRGFSEEEKAYFKSIRTKPTSLKIATDALGYSLIAAPNVLNAGRISAVDGQIVLAAGVGVTLRSPRAGDTAPTWASSQAGNAASSTVSGSIVMLQIRRSSQATRCGV